MDDIFEQSHTFGPPSVRDADGVPGNYHLRMRTSGHDLMPKLVVVATILVAGWAWVQAVALTTFTANILAWGALSSFGGSLQPLFDSEGRLLIYQATLDGSAPETGLALGFGLLLAGSTRVPRLLLRGGSDVAEAVTVLQRIGFATLLGGLAGLVANVALITLDTRMPRGFWYDHVMGGPLAGAMPGAGFQHVSIALAIPVVIGAALVARRLGRWTMVPLGIAGATIGLALFLPVYASRTYLCRLMADDYTRMLHASAIALLLIPALLMTLVDVRMSRPSAEGVPGR